jgi:phosphohistidine phosphatase
MAVTAYFIRHGIAAERGTYERDEDRPLVEKGRKRTRQVAQRLRDLDLHFDLLLTSPLVRAQQTADLLLQARLAHQIEVFPELAPGGQCDRWLTWLQEWLASPQAAETRQSANPSDAPAVALVGHQPDLSQWAEQLMGISTSGHLILKKAGILGLSLPNDVTMAVGQSDLFWLTPPKFLL